MKVTTGLKNWAIERHGLPLDTTDKVIEKKVTTALAEGSLPASKYAELSADDGSGNVGAAVKAAVRDELDSRMGEQRTTPSAASIITGGHVRVKNESEKYNTGSRFIRHKSGLPVFVDSKPVEIPSDRTRAKAGAWFKSWVRRQAGGDLPPLSEHERGLVREMAHEGLWAGPDSGSTDGWGSPRKMFDYEVKALIGDTGTGGSYLYPTEFDALAVTIPLLNGELFPFVDIQTAKYTSIQTPYIANPTVLWNDSIDGTAATLFSATGLISQLSTTFYPVSCFVEIGRDLLSNSAIDIAAILEQQIGQGMLTELDRVIASGSGSGEPLGLFNTVGMTTVPSANNGVGPLTVGDAELLYFALPKPYRADAMRTAYVASDTTYRRFRSTPVGVDDARRVFGMDHAAYTMLDRPFRVGATISDAKAAFVALAKYRMFRRQGFETRFTDQGITLFKSNTAILAVRGRFGGRMVDASAVAVMPNCPVSE